MAEAVDRAIRTGEHLAVQAGTGTGKSLAYLVPAIRHAVAAGTTVVVSTATIPGWPLRWSRC
jgi:ATP-dependent DNA helicase DinG